MQRRQVTETHYDVEGHLVRATLPNGLPGTITEAVYDLMGRVLGMDTSQGTTDILPLGYGYDAANNRICQVTATDTFYYGVDAANRLISEVTNRFVERTSSDFARGNLTSLDSTGGTASVGALSLLAYNDTFSGAVINADRWRLVTANIDLFGMEVPQSDGLGMAFPRGYSDVPAFYNEDMTAAGNNILVDPITLNSDAWAGAQHRLQLPGSAPLDVIVDFAEYQAGQACLMMHDTPLEGYLTGTYMMVMRYNGLPPILESCYRAYGILSGSTISTDTVTVYDPLQNGGKLRITQTGGSNNSYTAYYWSTVSASWVMLGSSPTTLTSSPMHVSLLMACPTPPDSDNVSFSNFQVAVSNSYTGPFNFVGPDGTYFTTSGTALHAGTHRPFCQYQATFTGTGSNTPVLNRVDVLYTGALKRRNGEEPAMSSIVPTEHPYMVRNDQILSGEPIVKGSRTPVRAVVQMWRLGDPPEAILQGLPHLSMAQIFDALSYYSDHQEEINGYIEANHIPEHLLHPSSTR